MIENLIETIKVAVAEGSTAEARAAGAAACRTILTALEATPGRPIPPAGPVPQPNAATTALVAALRGAPPEQLLDLVIAKLRSMVPADSQPAAPKMNIQLVRIPTP